MLTRKTLLTGLLLMTTSAVATADMVRVDMQTSEGPIVLELNADKAPVSVANFVEYANDGYFDGTVFHRVIEGFMVQGGGYTESLQRKDTRDPIKNEANNGLKNKRGSLAMARTQDPHSASAQFFINLADNDFLNFQNESVQGWGYCVFGEVVEGMEIVDKMALVETGRRGFHDDVPKDEIIIESATVA